LANARSLATLTCVEPTTETLVFVASCEVDFATRLDAVFLAEAPALGCVPAEAAWVGLGSFLGSPSSLATDALETFCALGTAYAWATFLRCA
jgi:hypothetical protein